MTGETLNVPDLPLPPRHIRNHDDDRYYATALSTITWIMQHVNVTPASAVVDIGCAAGRLACPLIDYLAPEEGGLYTGIDVIREAIQWAQKHITASHPHIRFLHADTYSKYMNPKGEIGPDRVELQISDKSTDLVILHSVFTHMLAPGFERHMVEIARILKPGGSLYCTAYVFDDEAKAASDNGTSGWILTHEVDGAMVVDPEKPELCVGLPEALMQDVARSVGLKLMHLHRGPWREGVKHGEDILLYECPQAALQQH